MPGDLPLRCNCSEVDGNGGARRSSLRDTRSTRNWILQRDKPGERGASSATTERKREEERSILLRVSSRELSRALRFDLYFWVLREGTSHGLPFVKGPADAVNYRTQLIIRYMCPTQITRPVRECLVALDLEKR